ncbi:tyrosine-type recombinase/integrase [uncultured Oscillibacter sp.]|jgi:integrase|uniref:tyrosine-type recombinase/integrase n=1 Tax=uncultured Oscillibacter sp. TaxID=876091 RepID=UPI0025EA9C43|nr:tyrosine-type recombinase/integrase [uncultured Oscillibacter sp.]
MREYVVNRPDEKAMEQALLENPGNAAGAVLRLAWQAGLLRDEIQRLTWEQVDFLDRCLVLPDRKVPIGQELADWLQVLRDGRDQSQETVVLSDRDKRPLTPQSISRLARLALNKQGQTDVRLIDLRHDFVLRQLEEHDWQYVSRITGVEAAGLNVHFAGHLEEKKISTRIHREESARIDEFALWKLLRTEGTSPAGIALWLTWQAGLRLEEIVALTWEQIQGDCLRLPRREVLLTSGTQQVLEELTAREGRRGYVLTAPRSGLPYDRTRLSKLARAALIRAGLDDLTLRDLRVDYALRSGGAGQILSQVRRQGWTTRNEVRSLLNVSQAVAYHRLKQLVNRGQLTQVGARYYLPGTVVPPNSQEAALVKYLEREGFAYRQDVARLLGIDAGQCRPLLRRMLARGTLIQDRQRYILSSRKDMAAASLLEAKTHEV